MGIAGLRRLVAAAVLAAASGASAWWWLNRYGPPTSGQAAQWLRQPLTTQTLVAAVLATAAVITSFTLAAAVRLALLAHTAGRCRRRIRVRFRPPTVARSVTAALVGTAGIAGLGDPAAVLATIGASGAPTDPHDGDRGAASPGRSDYLRPAPAARFAPAVGAPHALAAASPPTEAIGPDAGRWSITGHRLAAAGCGPAIGRLTVDRSEQDGWAYANRPLEMRQVSNLSVSSTGVPPAAGRLPVYTVRQSDWLGRIAERFLGAFDRYPEIQRLNPDLIDDADHIEPTWRLLLPADAHDRGARPHAAGRLAVNPPARSLPDLEDHESAPKGPPPTPGPGRTAPPADPTTPTTSPSEPLETATAAPGAISVPPGPGSAAPSTTGDVSTLPPATAARANHDRGGGVPLPGGWISLPFAAALVAAGAMVWRQRRHRYVPRSLSPDTRDDPDLRPLPAVMTQVRRAVRRQAPELLEPASPPPTVADYLAAASDQRPPLPPVGPTGPQLAGLGTPIPAGGVGLIGPGAEAAARALLVATLSAGSPADPDAKGHIIIAADTLTTLLGDDAVQVGPIPRLQVTGDLSEALIRADDLLIERRRILQDHDAADVAGMRAADPYHPPLPPVLLLAETPPTDLRARLTTTLHLGATLQVSAVLLGAWPPGDAVTVQADGHTDESGGRLAVLDTPTTVHLLTMLREAHTGEPADPPVGDTRNGNDLAGRHAADNGVAGHGLPPHGPTTLSGPPTTAMTASPTVLDEALPAPEFAMAATSATTAASGPSTPAATDSVAPHHDTPPAVRDQGRRVRLTVLGAPAIHDHDGHPVPGLRHHARELLVYLAVHRNGADLSQIMEAFWPDATVPRARERLSTEVGDLRRRIRQAAGDMSIQPVVNTGGRYHLDPRLVEVDAWHLIDALRQASSATDRDVRAELLRRAVTTHTGSLAQGYDYDWIEQSREHLRRHGIRVRLQLADLTGDANPTGAAELIRAAATLDPSNEDLAQQAMGALARAGDAASIRGILDGLRAALADIGEEPSRTTTALAADLERGLREIDDKTSSPNPALETLDRPDGPS